MPTYDYACEKCGHRMEVIHSLHAHGPSTCPVCGGQMKKVFAPPAVVFKGTGWARKERSGGHRSRGSGTGSSESSGGSETKSESTTKPDASTAAKDGD